MDILDMDNNYNGLVDTEILDWLTPGFPKWSCQYKIE